MDAPSLDRIEPKPVSAIDRANSPTQAETLELRATPVIGSNAEGEDGHAPRLSGTRRPSCL